MKKLLLFFIFLLLPYVCLGAEIKKTICPGGGCDYTSLEACLSANEQDLTDNGGDYFLAEIQEGTGWSSADTTAVSVDTWTTSPTCYIQIYTTSGARHDGKWNTGKYRLELGDSIALQISVSNVKVYGIQVYVNPTSQYKDAIRVTNAGNVEIAYCIIRKNVDSTSTDSRGVYVSYVPTGETFKAWNNVIYDFNDTNDRGMHLAATDNGSAHAYNNTVFNCTVGIYTGYEDTIVKNMLTNDCPDGFNNTFYTGSDYNVSDVSDDAPGSNPTTDPCSATFENEGNRDFHIQSSDACVKGYGVSDPGSGLFDDDIDGDTCASPWCIGADYIETATGDGAQVIIITN